jgi:hypothetical protein
MSEDKDEQTHPAMFNHALTVYETMLAEAKPYELDPDYHVWTGFLTHTFTDLGLSVPYYTKVMSLLKKMDCVRQLRRGGSTTPSEWLLMQPPTEELYTGVPGKHLTPHQTRMGIVEQQIKDLHHRISELEKLQE